MYDVNVHHSKNELYENDKIGPKIEESYVIQFIKDLELIYTIHIDVLKYNDCRITLIKYDGYDNLGHHKEKKKTVFNGRLSHQCNYDFLKDYIVSNFRKYKKIKKQDILALQDIKFGHLHITIEKLYRKDINYVSNSCHYQH